MSVAAVVALLAGVACGAFNGFLVAYVGLPSLAVTIGTLALFRGLAVVLLGTKAVTDFPDRWTDLASSVIGDTGLPRSILLFVLLAAVFTVLLHFTPFGRGIYDIGLNSEAAHFTGVNVERTKFILFVLSGAFAAIAGICLLGYSGSSFANVGEQYMLPSIIAVVFGGTPLSGGKGGYTGTMAGALLLVILQSILITINIDDSGRQMVFGVTLLVLMLFYGRGRSMRA